MKKKYVKPAVKKVKLVMDEAVLAGCKIRTGDPARSGRRCSSFGCRGTSGS